MARYIDADALWKQMFSYYGCINENTAKENYRGVTLMDYEVANLIEDCIDNAPTADVVPKSEVDDLRRYIILNEDIAIKCKRENGEQNEEYWKGKISAFRQIRAYIDAELKKKYTESEDTNGKN